MSRIHEALKRAEAQRTPSTAEAAPQAVASTEIPPDTLESPAFPPTGLADPLSHGDLGAKAAPAEYLRFDDVWNRCTAPGWKLNREFSVFANPEAPDSAVEQFRTLRSRLYQIREKQPLRTVLITSALAGEGKTVIASNLAQALARQQDCKVLLIDADLRCPELHYSFGAPNSPGLAEYLNGQATDLDIVQRGFSEYLCLIPGGQRPGNPAELLSNGRFRFLLERMAPVFDWVILDSPPTLPVSDALVLADLCDGVLTVVRAGRTSFESAQRLCLQLHEKHVIGAVLNCADEDHANGTYYYYGSKNGAHAPGAKDQ